MMRAVFLAAASLLGFAGGAAAASAGYELRLDEIDGQRTVAVSDPATGAFAIAAGMSDLRVLEGEEAKAAFDRLTKAGDIEHEGGEAGDERDAKGKRKIVIHKMDFDEDAAGEEKSREVRVIRRHQRASNEDRDVVIEPHGDDEDGDQRFEMDKDAGGEGSRRVIRIYGADADDALEFIDSAKGLDAAEKAAMKAAVGL